MKKDPQARRLLWHVQSLKDQIGILEQKIQAQNKVIEGKNAYIKSLKLQVDGKNKVIPGRPAKAPRNASR